MLLTKITSEVNKKLAGEMLTYLDLVSFLDSTIDDINSHLNSCYPAFSEIAKTDTEYNYFPDRYIRTVVIPGAAWYFYVADEEGTQTATQYATDYNRGLYLMLRDHLHNVPIEYQVDIQQGAVDFEFVQQAGSEGVFINMREW